MGRINVLDKHTAELIAAGEVVERPSSVIKELLENSIDAGAKNITVEIKNGGTTLMRVTDDGIGFMREDVRKAFLRHATSKVATEHDLDSIMTLGFRGEALASISAVSRVELITRSADEEEGTYYVINGGVEERLEDAGCNVGSNIIIRDLFYNIPARQKFLKKDVSEGNAVAQVVDRLSLSHPEVAFTFIRDSKQALKTSGDGKLLSAIYSVFGRDFAASLIPVDYELNGIRVEGFISKPEYSKASRSMQTFFVNNRYVRSRTAGAAIDEAAKGSVMVGKFLCCVLNISLPHSLVDVNVHPAKIEVRFQNERPLFDAVYHAVKGALYKGDTRKNVSFSNSKRENPFAQFDLLSHDVKKEPESAKPIPNKRVNPIDELNFSSVTMKRTEQTEDKKPFEVISKKQAVPIFNRDLSVGDRNRIDNYLESLEVISNIKREPEISVPERKPMPAVEVTKAQSMTDTAADTEVFASETVNEPQILIPEDIEYKYIGEAFSTYIIIEYKGELMLIDKHALHERIIYNSLRVNPQENTQLLLVPESVVLSKTDYSSAIENLDMFSQFGFEVEDFGSSTLLVRGAPQYITGEDITDTVTEMVSSIALNKRDISTEKMDWIFHNIACRAAVKAGNKSSEAELRDLVKMLISDDNLRYCPHGRPVCVVLKKSEVEKLFGRA